MLRLPSLTSFVAAGAIFALVAGATPARANNDDLIRFLAGAAAVAVVLHAIEGNRDRSRSAPNRRHHRQAVLPQQCAIEISTRREGRQVFYGERCLRQAGIRTRALPSQCAGTLRTERGARTIYGAACLRQAGYAAATRGQRAQGYWF